MIDDKDKERIEREGGIVDESEEKTAVSPAIGWILMFALCACILGWGMFIMMNVTDVDRRWDFGQYEDTPAVSSLSSSRGAGGGAEQQLPLPGGAPQRAQADSAGTMKEKK